MKKIFGIIVCLILCLGVFSGCFNSKEKMPNEEVEAIEQTEQKEDKANEGLPLEEPLDLAFSSGAGGWGTVITLKKDGSFVGEYHDTNFGEMTDEYPNGTVYVCEFKGKFTDIKKIDEYTYSMSLETLDANRDAETRIEDGVRIVASEPYGMEDGEKFMFYLPDTPVDRLSEEFLSWNIKYTFAEEKSKTLTQYGLENVKMGYGFFGAY